MNCPKCQFEKGHSFECPHYVPQEFPQYYTTKQLRKKWMKSWKFRFWYFWEKLILDIAVWYLYRKGKR